MTTNHPVEINQRKDLMTFGREFADSFQSLHSFFKACYEEYMFLSEKDELANKLQLSDLEYDIAVSFDMLSSYNDNIENALENTYQENVAKSLVHARYDASIVFLHKMFLAKEHELRRETYYRNHANSIIMKLSKAWCLSYPFMTHEFEKNPALLPRKNISLDSIL